MNSTLVNHESAIVGDMLDKSWPLSRMGLEYPEEIPAKASQIEALAFPIAGYSCRFAATLSRNTSAALDRGDRLAFA